MVGENTIAEYNRILNRINHIINNSPREQLKYLREKGLGISAIKTSISALHWNNPNDEYKTIIKELMTELKKTQSTNINRFKKIKWEQKKIEGNDINAVITGLYTLFPPRRIEDYAYMKYITKEGDIGEDNYYKNGEFIFNKYKTKRVYGTQRFKIEKKLKTLINKYIKDNKIKSGDLLLQYNGKHQIASERTLHRKLKEIFGVSVDGLRHAFITQLYRNPEELYNIEEVSEKMAHNVAMHIKYLDKENKK